MCGIFGIIARRDSKLSIPSIREMANNLFILSESRGKESAGIALRTKDSVLVYKAPIPASKVIKSSEYKSLYDSLQADGDLPKTICLIGHSRLVTNGIQTLPFNNQPVIKDGMVGVHNGIIVNDAGIWERFPSLKREYEVDTEVFLALLRSFSARYPLGEALAKAFHEIYGTASLGILVPDHDKAIIATNNGSLYICTDLAQTTLLFASEKYILEEFTKSDVCSSRLKIGTISQVKPGSGYIVDLDSLAIERIQFDNGGSPEAAIPGDKTPRVNRSPAVPIIDLSSLDDPSRASIKRCTKCILPETFPFIEFDDQGVCSVCGNFAPVNTHGLEALEQRLSKYRSRNGEPDCIVPISGGRDSCYGLHYIKTVLKMNPIAYTYDWGMVTDLARRNIARLCGKLGVEHILVSADIKRKRKNIRKNVEAWLKKPDLGIIPLFMAGDKQYFYYANKLVKQTGINLIIFSENLKYEAGRFKSGFCGIDEGKGRFNTMGIYNKAKLALYYLTGFIKNPSYLNSTLFDTLFGFYAYYFMKHDYTQLFEYIDWDEDTIISTLRNEYDWEISDDTKSTWRIGDGTAAFYNFIYYNAAGFTENDTFRSNQIRYGKISREEALKLVPDENKPMWKSMQWYASTNCFDLDDAIRQINSMPKLYRNKKHAS